MQGNEVMHQTPADIEAEFGTPDEVNESVVPLGSGWGLQPSLKHKIQEGEPVLHWQYFGSSFDKSYFFAKVSGKWQLTLEACVPVGTFRK